MAKQRARLNDDNNPLSPTDGVLDSYEQVSKLASQEDKKPTSQEVELLNSQPDSNLTLQEDNNLTSQEVDKLALQQSDNLTSEQVDNTTSQEDSKLAGSQDNNLTVQQANQPTSEEDSFAASQQALKSASQEPKVSLSKKDKADSCNSNKSRSQQVEPEKVVCRKSTFQINAKILDLLDKLHLNLQLEMGKANAPFKEVIVEEALVRLLEQVDIDRQAVVSALVQRQESRSKG